MIFCKEVKENYVFSQRINDTRKIITPPENRQSLLLRAPILISAIVFSYGDITLETTSIGLLKISMAKLKHFWPFFAIFLSEN